MRCLNHVSHAVLPTGELALQTAALYGYGLADVIRRCLDRRLLDLAQPVRHSPLPTP